MRAVLNHPYLQMTQKVTLQLFSVVPSLAPAERRVWLYALPDLLPTCIRGTSAALAPSAAWSPGRRLWMRAPVVESKAVTSPTPLLPTPTPLQHPPEPLREDPLPSLLSSWHQFMFVQLSKVQLCALWLQFNCLRWTLTSYSVVKKKKKTCSGLIYTELR